MIIGKKFEIMLDIIRVFRMIWLDQKIWGGGGQNHHLLSAKKIAQESKNAQYYRRILITQIGHNSLNNEVRAVLTVYLDFNFLRHS